MLRHTTAHVMAQAVARHFGMDNVEFAIGPVIEDGFYYDFDLPRWLTPRTCPRSRRSWDRSRTSASRSASRPNRARRRDRPRRPLKSSSSRS